MRLIIVHYHLRPGGIRRIIELATPHILKELGGKQCEVVLTTGEANDQRWNANLRKQLTGSRLTFFTEPSFGYVSELRGKPEGIRQRIRKGLDRLFDSGPPGETVVWFHNAGIARNLLLTRELAEICEERKIKLIAHHHDWWFDNRWLRWPEIQRCGFRTMAEAAKAVFPHTPQVRHCTINHSDAAVLKRHLHQHVFWIPNLTQPGKLPPRRRVEQARSWIQNQLSEKGAPFWVVPCRLLRRKNIAEALLLKQLLRPEAWLITTGAPSSKDELPYARKLQAAAEKHQWRMRLSILDNDANAPTVAELLAASECVLLTSIQEGFGLPYLEAATARRPLIARSLPNIAPDLKKFGFLFPHYYDEILVPLELIDAKAEKARQLNLYRHWKAQLPPVCRKWAEEPVFLQCQPTGAPTPFSRLTLTAQIEILKVDPELLWQSCLPFNTHLAQWKERAAAGKLQRTEWPPRADEWLRGSAYAKRWMRALRGEYPKSPTAREAAEAQEHFIQWKLGAEYLYPLLWSRKT